MTDSSNLVRLDNGKIVDGYKVIKKLGEGAFGAVYAVEDTMGRKAALKAESVNEKVPLLRLELIVMQRLKARNAVHMADLIDKGRFEHFNYIVMKLLGKSLQEAKKTGPNQHMSLGPAIGCSIQCLEALEELHWAGFLHRDVKPGNFAIGRAETGDIRRLYILDFGMCRKYVDNNNVMLQPRKKAPFRGTPRYAPIASHNGKEHCRRDDIESCKKNGTTANKAYMKTPLKQNVGSDHPYLMHQTLLKHHIRSDSCNASPNMVGKTKVNSRQEPLLSEMMKLCPRKEYKEVLDHIDSLQFFDEPNYELIYITLRRAMSRKSVKEFPYDWEEDR
ncbi:hypothetical protein DICVIV_01870 [Dictyocaulus viviparus]|uniref:Protein kinase domain-containing protein n=1 Tax=Dictyocaulus viviparus TaxID=29172 RepID=A0A0D8Y7L4_DICVI|nr:hypothetical protein DICVIV_01870 [Dictyocaulus viviparus]